MTPVRDLLLTALTVAQDAHINEALRARQRGNRAAVNAAMAELHQVQKLAARIMSGELVLCDNIKPVLPPDFAECVIDVEPNY